MIFQKPASSQDKYLEHWITDQFVFHYLVMLIISVLVLTDSFPLAHTYVVHSIHSGISALSLWLLEAWFALGLIRYSYERCSDLSLQFTYLTSTV
jgi:hypothetical protein